MAWLLLACSALFWAGNFVVGRLVAGEAGPLTLSIWRWGLATLIILPFAWPRIWRQRELIAFGLVLLKQTPTLRSLLGILTSCTGVIWLVSQGDLSTLLARGISEGDLWILGSSVVWAIYSLYLRFRPADLDPIAFLGFMCIVGTTAIGLVRLLNPFDETALPMQPHLLAAVGFFALFPSLGAYLCWNAGLARVGAARGGQMIHLMPVFGLTLATLFLGERMVAHHWVGGSLIAAGLLIALLPYKVKSNA